MASVETNVKDTAAPQRSIPPAALAVLAVLGVGLLWVYWPTLTELERRWSQDNQYSHGYLVPVFALVMLWMRRERLANIDWGCYWWGLSLLILGAALRMTAVVLYFDWLDAFSLLPCLAGVLVLLGGKKALAWSWPAIGFLVFMIPLPFKLQVALGFPLQRIATIASTYVLQTLGLPAFAEGNVILLSDHRLGVVEACNGLSMLVVFFALSAAVAFVINRPLWERLIVVASAIPIALLSNILRITLTGFLYEMVNSEWAEYVFHDLAGWLMMPLALVFLWLELQILSLSVIEVEKVGHQKVAALPPAIEKNEPPAPPAAKAEKAAKPAKAKQKVDQYAAAKAGLLSPKK